MISSVAAWRIVVTLVAVVMVPSVAAMVPPSFTVPSLMVVLPVNVLVPPMIIKPLPALTKLAAVAFPMVELTVSAPAAAEPWFPPTMKIRSKAAEPAILPPVIVAGPEVLSNKMPPVEIALVLVTVRAKPPCVIVMPVELGGTIRRLLKATPPVRVRSTLLR